MSDWKGAPILIVEDHWHVAHTMRVLLQDSGADVIGPVATLIEAEQLAAEQRPDLAIVNINLRGVMAYGLIDWLHRQGVRLVVVTGYSVLPQATADVAVILEKPFSAPALLAALREAAFGSVGRCPAT